MIMKYIKVELGGVDCTSFLRRAKKTETYGDAIAVYELEFTSNVSSLVTISNALTVEVWEENVSPPTVKTFYGFIDLFEPSAGIIKIKAKDELAKLINKQIMHYYDSSVPGDASYPDGKISEIFIDIVETYGGLSTNSGATVVDSGTEITLKKFTCRNADPFERCRKLSETLNWCMYYKASDGYVYFEPKNYTTNSNVLTVGTNIIEIPSWEYDRSEMINDLRLEGAQQLVQATQMFSGNASDTTFTLSAIPEDLAVYYSAAKNYSTTSKLASEIKVGDVVGAISTHDYEVDKKNKTIEFTSFVPASGTNNILVEVSYYAPIPVHMDEWQSKSIYSDYAKTITLTDVISLDDSMNRATNILNKYSVPFISGKLRVLWKPTYNFQIGQTIRVVDNINYPNVDEYMTIYKIVDSWPENSIQLEVGDKQYTIEEYQSNIIERVKRLEETIIGTTEATSEIVQQEVIFPLVPDETVVTLQVLNDCCVSDHSENSLIYDPDETGILDDFESAASWTGAGLVSIALADDSTAGHYWIGTQGVKATWTEDTGTGTVTKAITSIDMSPMTGESSGTPSSGTIGLWIYATSGASISEISLRIGSSASDYKSYIAKTYAQMKSVTGSFSLQDGLNYLVFNLSSPDGTAGSIDWTDIDYCQILFTVTAGSNCTFDYLTASKNDYIGLNGLGDESRVTTWSETTYTW